MIVPQKVQIRVPTANIPMVIGSDVVAPMFPARIVMPTRSAKRPTSSVATAATSPAVTDGNHIDVTVEHQRLAVTGSGQTPDEPPLGAAMRRPRNGTRSRSTPALWATPTCCVNGSTDAWVNSDERSRTSPALGGRRCDLEPNLLNAH